MRYYVYILYRDSEMTQPFYVGAGKGMAWDRHVWPSHLARQEPRVPVIQQVIRDLGWLPRRKIAERLTKEDAFALERALIAKIGRLPDGPLVNGTSGGNASHMEGKKHSAATRAKMSATAKRNGNNPSIYLSPEFYRDRRWSSETRQKMSVSQSARYSRMTPEQRRAEKPPTSEETRKRKSEAMKRVWERRRGGID